MRADYADNSGIMAIYELALDCPEPYRFFFFTAQKNPADLPLGFPRRESCLFQGLASFLFALALIFGHLDFWAS
ncbi:MAG: hypothetical protein NT142_07000 [Planctomycetota bacterium]|nr:hypothetical protein [Planctomycetota bacterium]